MNSKVKETRNDHRGIAILEAAGLRRMPSAGSLGEPDIIGIGSKNVMLCQVKIRDRRNLPDMWEL